MSGLNLKKSKDIKIESLKSDMTSFLKNYSKELNTIRRAYSEIKVINGNIINKPIRNDVLQELYSYCINYISAYKNICNTILLIFKNIKEEDTNKSSEYKYSEKDSDMLELIHILAKIYKKTDSYLKG